MQEIKDHTALTESVIRTLIYFDIFNYPLNAAEVFRFLNRNSVTERQVSDSLNALVGKGHLSKFGEFYSIQPDEAIVLRRIQGNKEAEKILPLAKRKATFISRFPFVRAVMASGSLSKNYMDENSDLDFFIVTAPDRLWISRTLLVLYKRIFLHNSHRHFCVNYFVDTTHLEIEEKNLFTATELATVLPLYGGQFYESLHRKNSAWLSEFFPNFILRDFANVPPFQMGIAKNIIEKTIDFCFGNFMDKMLMRLTLTRWQKLYQGNYAPEDFAVAFKTKKYASKNHPRNYQKKVMDVYQQKIQALAKNL